MTDLQEAAKLVRTMLPLLQLLTIRQVFDGGIEMIDAAGLDPWCMNEGKADGHEQAISSWKISELQRACDTILAQAPEGQ